MSCQLSELSDIAREEDEEELKVGRNESHGREQPFYILQIPLGGDANKHPVLGAKNGLSQEMPMHGPGKLAHKLRMSVC